MHIKTHKLVNCSLNILCLFLSHLKNILKTKTKTKKTTDKIPSFTQTNKMRMEVRSRGKDWSIYCAARLKICISICDKYVKQKAISLFPQYDLMRLNEIYNTLLFCPPKSLIKVLKKHYLEFYMFLIW